MGGLGPGIGGGEYLIIAIVALLVVGPERLPLLLRKLGKLVAKARGMANEFRSSFDEMARQSELDELRKEVEALRTGQMVPLGAEADAAFRDIRNDLNRPLHEPAAQPALSGPDEWPDAAPVVQPLETVEAQEATPGPKPKTVPKRKAEAKAGAPKAATTRTAPVKTASIKTAAGKPRAIRAKKVDL